MEKNIADSPIRVILLTKEFRSARRKLEESQAGADLEVVQVYSRDEFLRELRDATVDVIVTQSNGIQGLPLHHVLESASSIDPEVPVVVLGADGEDGADALEFLEAGAADYVSFAEIVRLPRALRRLLREREAHRRQQELETEVRQAYDALLSNQKLTAIGQLAASIAHEINNPLESITNLLYLLRNEPDLSSTVTRYIDLAEREMSRVAQISKQTLNFYRETPVPVRVLPSDLLDEVLVLYSRKIEERQLTVVQQYTTDRPLVVFPGEMRQVLSNLVTNAIEASPVGGRLTLRVHNARKWTDAGIQGVRIIVADNGCGISTETRQRLGQLFYTTKGQRGTGLGLWVTQAIVRRYGGEIQLYSSTREGRHGTVFSIFMPTNLRPKAVAREWDPTDQGGGKFRRGSGVTVEAKAKGRRDKSFGNESARNLSRRNDSAISSAS